MPAMFESVVYEQRRQITQGPLPPGIPHGADPTRNPPPSSTWAHFKVLTTDISFRATVVVLTGVQHAGNLASVLQSASARGQFWLFILSGLDPRFVDKGFEIARIDDDSRAKITMVNEFDELTPQQVMQQVRLLGFELVTFTEAGDAIPVWDVDMLQPRQALIFGQESGGIPREVLALEGTRSTIPQAVGIGNLNVATAVEAALYEWQRQRVGFRPR